MCGLRVDRRTEDRRGAPEKSRANAMANAQLPTPESRRALAESSRARAATMVATSVQDPPRARPHVTAENVSSPSVSGPSFLGLNDPAETEYLLEDERSSHGGLRALLLLIVLGAIAGLIFVQYRSSLKASPKSPEMPKPAPASLPQPHGQNQPPVTDKALVAVTGARDLQSGVMAVAKAAVTEESQNSRTEPDKPDKKAKKLTVAETTRTEDADDPAPDPPAATKNKPSAALTKAQQYLHGRGVRQNCEQGLVYLKAATEQNDPNAAVQMAALYASGFCVHRDRVKAYQWFSSARDMEPKNRWITKNMNQLWAQMTSRERRQVR